MNSRRAAETALVVGGLWGFVEIAFAYTTGSLPATDALRIGLAPVAVVGAYQLATFALWRSHPRAIYDLLAAASVLLPPVLLFLRGRGQRAPVHFVAGVVPIGLSLLLLFLERRKPSERGWLTSWRVTSILVIDFVGALAFILRADRNATLTSATAATAALWCCALAGLGALVLALAGRRAGPAFFAALIVMSLAITGQRGSHPPSFKGRAVRSATSRPAKGAPNVLLIVLDTVRAADHLDLYGYSRPTLARTGRYLKDGLVFNRATSSSTFSLPSHGSLFTGLLASAHGAHPTMGGSVRYGRLRTDAETLATFLRGKGYRTAGISANDIFLLEWTGLQRGFDAFSATGVRRARFQSLVSVMQRLSRPGQGIRPLGNTWSAAQMTDAALDIVGQGDEPYFLFLNYFDAHEPRVATGSPPWFDAATAKAPDVYDTRIAYMDSEIARLLGSLEQSGRLADTLVILTADHGEYFGERKLRSHPPEVYEPSTHVPLAVRLPGVVAPGRTERRTALHEIFRMVRDIQAGNSLDWLRDVDLTPRILTEAWSRRDYGEVRPTDGRPSTTVVFSGNLKLIHRLSGRNELFDLETDPAEERDLIASTDPRVVALKARMLREIDRRVVSPSGPVQALDEDVKERLRALGYLR